MSDTTENFWKAWEEEVPTPAKIFYRLYYNDTGSLICYTMEDLPGNYIEVDRETYVLGSPNVKVVDGKLIKIQPKMHITKLYPNAIDGIECDPRDVCVVVAQDQPHTKWNVKTYEIN